MSTISHAAALINIRSCTIKFTDVIDMPRKLSILIVVICLLGLGCSDEAERTPALSSSLLSEPVQISQDGDFAHESSGMIFPKVITEFERVEITRFDEEGHNVATGYNMYTQEGNLYATVYVYPALEELDNNSTKENTQSSVDETLTEHFEMINKILLMQNPDWSLIDNGVSDIHPEYKGSFAEYQFTDNRTIDAQKMRSILALYLVNQKWFVKFRFTYHEKGMKILEPQIKQLAQALTWPQS